MPLEQGGLVCSLEKMVPEGHPSGTAFKTEQGAAFQGCCTVAKDDAGPGWVSTRMS